MKNKETDQKTKNLKPKNFGATSIQIGENDAASLIGGIVEKGFSDNRALRPPAVPRPTVVPFPVARHRSHGPHWDPNIGKFNGNNQEDDTDNVNGEDEEFSGMKFVAGVVNPVHRKEKKGLDFSRWQEIMKNDSAKEQDMNVTRSRVGNKANQDFSDKLTRKIDDPRVGELNQNFVQPVQSTQNGTVKSKKNNKTEMVVESETPKTNIESGFSESVSENRTSLEGQIDAENRARLANMSPEEIEEARAEIMAKMNPELINALRKRSQVKSKKQKVEPNTTQPEEDLSKSKVSSESNTPRKKPVNEVPAEAKTNQEENKVPQNMNTKNGRLWSAWRERVERVRNLRFSLEGDIIDTDFARVSDNGSASSQIGYSADNVSERDFLRTEGDPAAAGYTIKETIALTRSVVPGQRALALHLISTVLDRAIRSICQNPIGSASDSVDWEAIWAFTLGPEPEISLSLRMSLDDNHYSVILTCAKAIQSVLSCDMNEFFFDLSEKASSDYVFTAPVFRSKPDIHSGFLRGGFWKYNTKPSNILPSIGEESLSENGEDERTIQDDIVVAGQDIAAGLVRMGILPRICYLLETDPSAPLEECLISILIAIARHSPTCADAVVKTERLVQTITNRFNSNEHQEIDPCKIKSVTLLKVLAKLGKKNCSSFTNSGIFRRLTWHLYRHPFSLDQWAKSGKESCKCSSALLVEQLRLLRVFIHYGYFISDISELFGSLCIWLSVPTIELLIDNDVTNEYFAIVREAYLLVNVLAARLPNFYKRMEENNNESWSQFGTIIDLALEWIKVKRNPYFSRFLFKECENPVLQDSLTWVFSSVLNMLSTVLEAVIPDDISGRKLSWLPEFVPEIGLEIIKNGFFSLSKVNETSENESIVMYLHRLRLKKSRETATSSMCCLQGLLRVVDSVDKLIQHANLDIHKASYQKSLSFEDKILADGILNSSTVELRQLLTTLMELIDKESDWVRSIEVFSRGGPAPGVGVGWGAPGGGFWSLKTFLSQQDAKLLAHLLEITEIPSANESGLTMQSLNSALAAPLTVGPGNNNNNSVINKLMNFVFRVPSLKHLDFAIRRFLSLKKGYEPFEWNYGEEEYRLFASILPTHFESRWLGVKKSKNSKGEINGAKSLKKGNRSLETIDEDNEGSPLTHEWAHQRLHLPAHWFLSAISTVHSEKTYPILNAFDVAKGGLFFLLGMESIQDSPFKCVPIVWKLHALSVTLLSGMGVLEDEKSRGVFETLQNLYGEILDQNSKIQPLQFVSEIHENYSTFVETLVDQFAAESYGDVLFGRQILLYLHRSVEDDVRLATWNALSNCLALELLPPLDKCFVKAEGFLEPIEVDERILEAYVKYWVSGSLDKAFTRNSSASLLVLHHLSSFIYGDVAHNMLSLRNKLATFILRDYSQKQKHEGMVLKLIQYKKPVPTLNPITVMDQSVDICETERRLQILKEISQGNSSLVAAVKKLETSIISREFPDRPSS